MPHRLRSIKVGQLIRCRFVVVALPTEIHLVAVCRSIGDRSPRWNTQIWFAPDAASTGYTMASDVFSLGMGILSIAELETAFHEPPHTVGNRISPGTAIQLNFERTGEVNIKIPESFNDFPGDDGDGPASRLRMLIHGCLAANYLERPSMSTICSELRSILKVERTIAFLLGYKYPYHSGRNFKLLRSHSCLVTKKHSSRILQI